MLSRHDENTYDDTGSGFFYDFLASMQIIVCSVNLGGAMLCFTLFFSIMGCGDKVEDSATEPTVSEPSNTDPDPQEPTCEVMCAQTLICEDVTDRDLIFGTTQEECETRCNGDMPWYMKNCIMHTGTCDGIRECTRYTTVDDDFICARACELIVSDCGLATDTGQCQIDCNMTLSGFAGAFYGAGVLCWEMASEHGDCSIAEQCPAMYY